MCEREYDELKKCMQKPTQQHLQHASFTFQHNILIWRRGGRGALIQASAQLWRISGAVA